MFKETKMYSHNEENVFRVLHFDDQDDLLKYFLLNFDIWKSHKMATKVIGTKLLIFKKGE